MVKKLISLACLSFAIVSFGSAVLAQPANVITLTPPPGVIGGDYGRCIFGLRDADGDGQPDLAVTAFYQRLPSDPNEGLVYVYRGVGPEIFTRLLSPVAGTRNVGLSAAEVGDVNADGRSDIVVSAHLDSTPGSPAFAGRAYLFSGSTGQVLRAFQSIDEHFGLNFSHDGVDGVPDLDGDGVPDVLVSSTQEGPDLSGRVYVFSGATGALLHLLESPQPVPDGTFGFTIAGTPDMDGDGMGDIIVSAVREPQIPGQSLPDGVTYLISGATGQPYQRLPYKSIHVASVPDVDGDGRPDVLLANDVTPPGGWCGTVWVISGATGELIYALECPHTHMQFAWNVAGGPDIDGDGRGDFMVDARSAFRWNGLFGLQLEGAVFLYSGANGRLLRTFISPHFGEYNGGLDSAFGTSLAFMPDINGDALPEFVMGAQNENYPNVSGRVYVFLSCAADFDRSGDLTSQDFFDFLNAFFSAQPSADFNHDDSVNTQDFFEFLAAFFAGC